ncbi:protein kinase [Archangium violaceum]|uniref:protein kinase domain-containing protein n=1 Tax=Archangium violaceum TaxID=83451 RepID=UPI00193B4190|nr:protein kinase [Archangium violaceum]QRK05235.1 protein kinase [Archangium violaceum]
MPAQHHSLGEPAHEAERQAIRLIVEGLPEDYTVYSNAWLVERTGVVHELDVVVVAPHGLYVVELKAYRGVVRGTDHDWDVPQGPIRSPLKKNRHTTQVLANELKRLSAEAARRWVEHFVFLSHASAVQVEGPASRGRIHTRHTLLEALQDERGFHDRCPRGVSPEVDEHTRRTVHTLLSQQDPAQRPTTRIRGWRIESTLEATERWVDHMALNELAQTRAVLRVYALSPLATDAERNHLVERMRWEAQVLHRVGQHRAILRAEPFFEDDAGRLCLPLEDFQGVTLPTWLAHHRKQLSGREGLKALAHLWDEVADAVAHAHGQGVVHRLLRPEVVLLEDKAPDAQVRLTGFDLAKQLQSGRTVHITSLQDERMRFAAPEVTQSFTNATVHSDQWGLGFLLGWFLTGRALFESTAERIRRGGPVLSVAMHNALVPRSLDEAVGRMLSLRPADRFSSLKEAREAVAAAVDPSRRAGRRPESPQVDPDDLPEDYRLGADYEIKNKLGEGGLATVYAALHLVSGQMRALKVARNTAEAEEALMAEWRVLEQLDHKNIVRVKDPSNALVPGRRTLVMDRVKGASLSKWLAAHPSPDRDSQRRFAEDLFAALEYLESRGITHKDLKPDNLVVGEAGLTVIDFSLAGHQPDDILVGSVLWRDPTLKAWDAAADRYAAALVLHQLFTGRHPFDGRVPSPDELPHIEPDDFDSPGLARFFQKALSPERRQRFASAREMREFFREALGERERSPRSGLPLLSVDASNEPEAPLGASRLSGTAVAVLARAGVRTKGELVALQPQQLSTISGLGKKRREEVLAFREELLSRGIQPSAQQSVRRVLLPEAEGDEAELSVLQLPSPLEGALVSAGFRSVGRLAGATREDLTAVSGVGSGKLAQVVEALELYVNRRVGPGSEGPRRPSVEKVWAEARRRLEGREEAVLAATFGFHGPPAQRQQDVAEQLELSQPEVSRTLNNALVKVDREALEELRESLHAELDAAAGVMKLDELVERLHEAWVPSPRLETAGLVRLIQRMHETRLHRMPLPEEPEQEVLFLAPLEEKTLRSFVETALRLAGWDDGEPTEPGAARRTLRGVLPEYLGDFLRLAVYLVPSLRLTADGELFQSPLEGSQVLRHVLRRARLPLKVDELYRQMEVTFGEHGWNPPTREALPEVLAQVLPDYRVVGDEVVPASVRVEPEKSPTKDPLPSDFLVSQRTYSEVVAERLREAAKGRGYRLVVAPPACHVEVADSLKRTLGENAVLVSFEKELLQRMEPDFGAFERAERFLAQRPKLKKEAEALLDALLAEHGRPGKVVVLGDTGILGVCGVEKDVPRRLYDRVTERDLGFWVLVIPGVVSERQPLFNEKTPVLNLQVLPVDAPLDAEARD